jgi:hypothetical protein
MSSSRRWTSSAVSGQSIQRSNETLLTERSEGWANEAVAEPVARGLGASQSSGLWFFTTGRKSGVGAGGIERDWRVHKRSGVQPARREVSEVWLRVVPPFRELERARTKVLNRPIANRDMNTGI